MESIEDFMGGISDSRSAALVVSKPLRSSRFPHRKGKSLKGRKEAHEGTTRTSCLLIQTEI